MPCRPRVSTSVGVSVGGGLAAAKLKAGNSTSVGVGVGGGLAAAKLKAGELGAAGGLAAVPRAIHSESPCILGNQLGNGSCEIPPTCYPGTNFTVSLFQHIGHRRTQEDRFAVVPQSDFGGGAGPMAFFGVFDGTAGDFASETVKDLFVPKLTEFLHGRQPLLRQHAAATGAVARSVDQEQFLCSFTRDLYRSVDDALLQKCSSNSQHYSTCTSVTLMVVGDLLVVGHLGDSRIVLGKECDSRKGEIIGEQLTMDHKPDLEHERQRIEQCGGLVERLQSHSNKPFLRGGDFVMRKALGEQPMQLQYSRAFGAKDLKIFGMSNVPDVRVIRMGSQSYRRCRVVILASDGLWDVVSAQQAATIAVGAAELEQSPAEELVRCALSEQTRRKARADNVTVLCIVFH
eukprot:TRINITY_DN30569_c0_g1_i1.p1 TRINITY_DN30569_c0_g1~~TRINITY_DN30569_c0_g1_i1.p1  ORF type:complete len:410 (+),score=65.42 TRINITY_DN30569_c0_g1_i1:25-1230(+)